MALLSHDHAAQYARKLLELVESGEIRKLHVLAEFSDGRLEFIDGGGLEYQDLRVNSMYARAWLVPLVDSI